MRIIRYNENMLDECAELWWELYGRKPYIIRPDGYEHPSAPSVGPNVFRRQIDEALSGCALSHWAGEVTPDSILLAQDKGKVVGIIVCSVNHKELVGYIRSAFMHRDDRGQEVAYLLVNEAIEYFEKLGLRKAEVGPSGSLEVESPVHIAALEAGFACEDNWEQAEEQADGTWRVVYDVRPRYLFYLGGPLDGFQLQPEIQENIEALRKQEIIIRSVTHEELEHLRRYDTHEPLSEVPDPSDEATFVAIVDGLLVGWLWGGPCRQTPEVIARCDAPYVVPDYRRRGIGKALYHLTTDKLVRQGAQYGFGYAGIHSPFRLILRSVGFQHWFLGFGWLSKHLS